MQIYVTLVMFLVFTTLIGLWNYFSTFRTGLYDQSGGVGPRPRFRPPRRRYRRSRWPQSWWPYYYPDYNNCRNYAEQVCRYSPDPVNCYGWAYDRCRTGYA